jgi:hypothetical protein
MATPEEACSRCRLRFARGQAVMCPTRANQESLSAARSLAPPKSLRKSHARKIEFAEPIQRDLGFQSHGEKYFASANCQS